MRLSGKSMLNSVENKHSIRNIKNKAKRLIEFDHVLTAYKSEMQTVIHTES